MCEIDFSKEFLNIEKDKLEQVYESIVYTITEFKDIEKVKILVEGKEEKILDRNIGINKIYDINSLKNITNTTIYYLNDSEDEVYYTPVTKIHNDEREKIEIIIEELKSSLIYQSNLSSYLSNQTKLKEYKIKENVMHITFNDKIFDEFDTNKILEEVKYTINMSVKDNYNVDKVVFNVNDKEIATTVLKTLEN